jgi:hypothetical protein
MIDPMNEMNIKIHITGLDNPMCIPISKAGVIATKLEQEGKQFRFGDTVDLPQKPQNSMF